jgi:hypothetical protein
MPKGMYTQGVCILLDRAASLDEIEVALGGTDIRARHDAANSWAFGGPTLIVAYLPESNGFVAVDTVGEQWPDHMGDPKDETTIFGAWSMGHFAPFAFPGSLQRAAEQSWAWERGKAIPAQHQAFIRIRSSYAFGAKDDDPVMPNDYQPLPELEFVTKLASVLLDLPCSLCYFNPGGEVLLDQEGLFGSMNFASSNDLPSLDAWSNVRVFSVNAEWSLMDTVGNSQLDIPDAEACFYSESFDLGDVANFLRNVSLYLLNNGEVIKEGDTMDGPGDIKWQSRRFDDGICDPPRPVLRWLPMDGRPVPPEILPAEDSP